MSAFRFGDLGDPTLIALLEKGNDLFTDPAWLGLIADHYSFPVSVVADTKSGATLPVACIDDLAGRRLVSFPFSDYIAPPGPASAYLALAEAAVSMFPEAVARMSLAASGDGMDEDAWTQSGWIVSQASVYHRVLFSAGEAAAWDSMSVAFRNQVRQGLRNGVTVTVSQSVEAIDRFFNLHCQLRNKKFMSIPQSKGFFHDIHARFAPNGRLFVFESRLDGQTAAACVAISRGSRLYYKFSSSDPTLLTSRANNVMLWELVRFAVREGYAEVDLGRSGLSNSYRGLRHFKEGLGGQAFPIMTLNRPLAAPLREQENLFRALVNGVVDAVVLHETREDLNDRISRLIYRFFV